MRVLVLGGIIARAGLAISRSLGRRGVTVELGDHYRINPTRFSKYVSKAFVYPSPIDKPYDFFEWLHNHIKKRSYDMVIPINDYTYEICTRHQKELLPYTRMGVNDWETFEIARDKSKTFEQAAKVGVPMPKTWVPKSMDELEQISRELPEYPILMKPARSSGSRGLIVVHNKADLLKNYAKLSQRFGTMLVQEFIPGQQVLDVPMIFNMQKEIRAAMVSNRIRMYPVEAGPNTAGYAVINEPLRQKAVQLMESIGWKGVCLVEFRVDERDGIPKLMEINPRFWGSLQLGITAGIDWPWMLFQAVMMGDCEKQMEYHTGRLVRWLIPGELMHLLTRKNKKDLWPDFFRFFDKNTSYYIFNKDDMMPAFGLLLTIARQVVNPKMIRYYFFRN